MARNETTSFVFYLCLSDVQPHSYFLLSNKLKKENIVLVPVRFEQLQKLLSATDQAEVIVISSVRNIQEAVFYQKNVRKHLKYLLKSERITLILLSSFSNLNDQKNHLVKRNYLFLKYPLDLGHICQLIARVLELKQEKSQRWPGGKRSQPGVVL
jgi:hypothetical protein